MKTTVDSFLLQLGENPTQIGLLFLLYAGVYALSSPVIGWIGDKTVSTAPRRAAVKSTPLTKQQREWIQVLTRATPK